MRLSQQHYAALDGYCLIGILKELAKIAENGKGPLLSKYVRKLDNRHIIVEQQLDGPGLFEDDEFYEKEAQQRNKLNNERL